MMRSLFLSLIFLSACRPTASSNPSFFGVNTTGKIDFTDEELAGLDAEFHSAFDAEFATMSGPLEIKFFKTIPSLLSLATMKDPAHYVGIMGGNLDKSKMTLDSLRLLVCHELGHFLGGGPRRMAIDANEDQEWNVIEGASDYYASLNCMKRVLKGQDHAAVLQDLPASAYIQESCAQAHAASDDRQICERSLHAALKLARFFASIRGMDPDALSLEASDANSIAATTALHPETQCRLDTFRAGALCPVSPEVLDPKDLSRGTCDSEAYPVVMQRPRCWFNPKDFELPDTATKL